MGALGNKQRGIGFAGLILLIAVVILIAVLGMKLVPAYMHNGQIVHIFQAIASDPEMRNASVKDIRASFEKRALMDNISEIGAEDVQIDKEGGRLALSASYPVKIPVVGNISLLLEFNPSSAK
ncbi:MAG: DUF4845 domain-containing protein [Gallionellaceae bacterium]|nr:MAG: DUF4845 domain-containing protein [Gallionellaceae bacterium]